MTRRIIALVATSLMFCLALVGMPAPSGAEPSRAELEAAEARLMELEREFEIVVERYNLVHDELDLLRAKIAFADRAVRGIRSRMVTKEGAAVALAVELYKGGGASESAFEAVLSSDSPAQIEQRLQYLESSETEQSKVFERLAVDKALLDSKVEILEEATIEAQAEENRLASLREEIEAKVASQQDEIAQLNEVIARAEARRERVARAEARRAATAARAAERAQEEAEAAAPAPAPPAPAAPAEPADPIEAAPAPNGGAQAAVDAALSQMGKPYRWGAEGPDSYDCSGLTLWAWAHAGVSLPHNSGAQYAATPRVAQNDWQPGDLLFFGSPIHHVAMYIGNGRMVEAPYTGSQVRINDAYRPDYVGAGRP